MNYSILNVFPLFPSSTRKYGKFSKKKCWMKKSRKKATLNCKKIYKYGNDPQQSDSLKMWVHSTRPHQKWTTIEEVKFVKKEKN